MESSVKKTSPLVLEWMEILSKDHGMLLFEAAKTGIKGDPDSAVKFGLSKKQYYTRLKALSDCGLVSKIDDMHFQTELGRLVFNNILNLQTLERKDNKTLIGMVQTLIDARRFTQEDLEKIRSKYSL